MSNQLESLADTPGTAREYETIYILRPGCTNDQVADVNTRVRNIIEERGGKVIKVDNWGKRRLAYEVATERKGIYLYWQYLAGAGVVEEFERNMRMLDSVIRYMTVKLDADVDPGARPTEVDDETYERAATTAADEEDMYLQRSDAERAEDEAAEGEAAEGEAAEGEAAEAKSDEAKSDEAKPAEGETAEAKPAEGETAEAKPAEGETAEKKSEQKSGEEE